MAKDKENAGKTPEEGGLAAGQNGDGAEVKQDEQAARKAGKADKKADRKAVKETPEQKRIRELEEKIESLEKEKKDLSEKVDKEADDYVRLMAEFENFRRRTSEERLKLVGSASRETIKGLLPVLDDCERALQILEQSSDEAAKEGTALIYNKLMKYLQTKGLEPIKAKGEKFDTDFHEAVAQFPVQEDDKKGKVFDVVETGYLLGGAVLRYAKVVVGV